VTSPLFLRVGIGWSLLGGKARAKMEQILRVQGYGRCQLLPFGRRVTVRDSLVAYFGNTALASHKVRTWKQVEDWLRNMQILKDSLNTSKKEDFQHPLST